MESTYDDPVMLAHDLSVINVTPEQIVIRQAKTSMLVEAPEAPELEGVVRVWCRKLLEVPRRQGLACRGKNPVKIQVGNECGVFAAIPKTFIRRL